MLTVGGHAVTYMDTGATSFGNLIRYGKQFYYLIMEK